METGVEEEQERKGSNLCFKVVISIALTVCFLFVVLVVVGRAVLPRQADMEPHEWLAHDPTVLALVYWGTSPWSRAYIAFNDGHKLVGLTRFPLLRVLFEAPFELELKSDLYAFSYDKDRVAMVIYKRSSLFERFAVFYEEAISDKEVLGLIAEGERRMELKKRALREECEKYERIWSPGS